MQNIPIDITYIKEQLNLLYEEVLLLWDRKSSDKTIEDTPDILYAETIILLNIISDACIVEEKKVSIDIPDNRKKINLHDIGNNGIQLLSALSDLASQLNLPDTARQFELLTLPFAILNARLNIEITELEAPVNAISYLANNINEPKELALLYRHINELIIAIPPSITEDIKTNNPDRPWRILLLNRAIIATRTLQTILMEPAFDSIVENLPEESAQFFEQGMEQMDLIEYPKDVTDVMRRYHLLHQNKHTLH